MITSSSSSGTARWTVSPVASRILAISATASSRRLVSLEPASPTVSALVVRPQRVVSEPTVRTQPAWCSVCRLRWTEVFGSSSARASSDTPMG
jgi:hypothetical protein